MVWKPLIFLIVVAVGVLAGQYELKGHKKARLEETMEKACREFANETQQTQVQVLAMHAAVCVYSNVDMFIDMFMSGRRIRPQENVTHDEFVMEAVSQFCRVRQQLRECAQEFLQQIAHCTSPPVQAKLGDMKAAITELFKYFCDNDMTRPRRVIDDGIVDCVEKNIEKVNNCTKDMVHIATDMPEDTNSFEAIEMCYKYDTMVSCLLDTLTACPKSSAKEFIQDVTSLFRSGTFCRVTVPVDTGNEV